MLANIALFIVIALAIVYIIYDSKKAIKAKNNIENNKTVIKSQIQKSESYNEDETFLWEEEYLMIEIIPAANYEYLFDKNIDKRKALSSYSKIKTETLKIEINEFFPGEFVRDLITLSSGSRGGCIWRLRATNDLLACAIGSRNGTEDTKVILLDFDSVYP